MRQKHPAHQAQSEILADVQQAIRIKKLSANATRPTKGSRLAAGHNIHPINEFTIPAQGQVLSETGIAIRLPKGRYARIAPRSGLASKKGIAINGDVIDADYTGEVNVIMINHGKIGCRIQAGDRIAQLINEKTYTSDVMEVDDPEVTEQAGKGFAITDMLPKRTTVVTDCKLIICFLQANQENNEYFDAEDMGRHPRMRREHVLMSSASISLVETQNFDAEFISKMITASKGDQEWQERLTELEKLREEGKEFSKNWQSKDRLLYYKNWLYIPNNDELHTAIAKGCHDS